MAYALNNKMPKAQKIPYIKLYFGTNFLVLPKYKILRHKQRFNISNKHNIELPLPTKNKQVKFSTRYYLQ